MSEPLAPDRDDREVAERIISGDYNTCVVLMLDKDHNIQYYWNGGSVEALGLAKYATLKLERAILDEEGEE